MQLLSQKSRTCNITLSLLQYVLKMSASSTNASAFSHFIQALLLTKAVRQLHTEPNYDRKQFQINPGHRWGVNITC